MAQIAPFRAIRYAAREVSALVAPPYDVLEQKDKDALLARSDRNIVAIDLPHVPPKQAGPAAAYERSAAMLANQLADGTLKQDERPAFYVYHQQYTHAGRAFVRRMFFVRLRLEEFGWGQVFPHEQTFGGPKEDRLLLTRATRCNLSPIFGLYPDADNAVAAAFEAAVAREPDQVGVLDGVESRLWAVTDEAVVRRVSAMMADKPVFIADGHHRYGTAIMYKSELEQGGSLPPDHPARFVLCVMAGMEDPGLAILPTHRVICGTPELTAQAVGDALRDRFDVTAGPSGANGRALCESLPRYGPLAMAVWCSADGAALFIHPKDMDLLAAYEANRKPAWRRYGLAILHRYIIDEVIRPRFLGGREATIHYIKGDDAAIAEARAEKGIVFLPQPTTMAELRDICSAGELMPQKSTFFFPKLATGMVINPLS